MTGDLKTTETIETCTRGFSIQALRYSNVKTCSKRDNIIVDRLKGANLPPGDKCFYLGLPVQILVGMACLLAQVTLGPLEYL